MAKRPQNKHGIRKLAGSVEIDPTHCDSLCWETSIERTHMYVSAPKTWLPGKREVYTTQNHTQILCDYIEHN